MDFSKFMELCSLHHSLILEHLCYPQKKLLAHFWSFPVSVPCPDSHQSASYLCRLTFSKIFSELL